MSKPWPFAYMNRRDAAYRRGWTDALGTLKMNLFNDAEQRIDERRPYDLSTLSEYVMDTICEMANDPPERTGKWPDPWSPFNRKGKLRLTLYTDPWYKRAWARLRGEPMWHQAGALKEDEGEKR